MLSSIPTLWRIELLHPLSVHFPIVFLLCATLLSFVLPFLRSSSRLSNTRRLRNWFLFLGCLTAWLANYTGSLAEDVVNRVICDPTVTHQHEDLARASAIIYSIALLLALLAMPLFKAGQVLLRHLLELSLCLLGFIYLLQAAHLGVSLVFQQGAAVYKPTEMCEEFE